MSDFLDDMIERRNLKQAVTVRAYAKRVHPEHYDSLRYTFPNHDAVFIDCQACMFAAAVTGMELAASDE